MLKKQTSAATEDYQYAEFAVLPENESDVSIASEEAVEKRSVLIIDATDYEDGTKDAPSIDAIAAHRDLDEIAADIKHLESQAAATFIDIGKLFIEAKRQFVKRGHFVRWAEENSGLTVSYVQRLMKIAKEYPNAYPVTHLGVSKAYTLLKIPETEREPFIEESHMVNGVIKSVAEMNKKEFEKVVRERIGESERKNASSRESNEKSERQSAHNVTFAKQIDASMAHVDFLQASIEGLLDSIEKMINEQEKRNEIACALRDVCEDAMLRIDKILS